MGAVPDSANRLVIAIDGPSGAGKSSTAKEVAARLGLRYLDTGALYRAVTWWMLRHGVDVHDPVAVAAAADRPSLAVGTDPAAPSVRVDDTAVADEALRSAEVTAAVSAVSAVPEVRRQLLELQRELVDAGGIVVEGRDIGTVVAPDAGVKVFLTAAASARAQRRAAELPADLRPTAQSDLARRDRQDSERPLSPLMAAANAVQLDTTNLPLDAVVDSVVRLAEHLLAGERR